MADGGFGDAQPNGTGSGTAFFIDNLELRVGSSSAVQAINTLNEQYPIADATDVDGSGETVPLDALLVLNQLNNGLADQVFARFEVIEDEDE